jgi:hypothetical protein
MRLCVPKTKGINIRNNPLRAIRWPKIVPMQTNEFPKLLSEKPDHFFAHFANVFRAQAFCV